MIGAFQYYLEDDKKTMANALDLLSVIFFKDFFSLNQYTTIEKNTLSLFSCKTNPRLFDSFKTILLERQSLVCGTCIFVSEIFILTEIGNTMKKLFLTSGVVVLFLILIGLGLYWCFFCSMKNLPQGEMINSFPSPYSDCKLNIYLVNGGATTDYAIRGSIVYENGRQKNIYWNIHEYEATVNWIDKDNVAINGVQLNIRREVYDFRKSNLKFSAVFNP